MAFYQASPSRIHQEILGSLLAAIYNYIKSRNEACKVYPAPFAVKLHRDRDTIIEPDISVICDPDKLTEKSCTVFVYKLEEAQFNNIFCSFHDKIKAGIFEDLYISLEEFDQK